MEATIIDVKIKKTNELWKKKPKGLGFEDTDAVIVSAKTGQGDLIKETFFISIKPDGTFGLKTLNRSSDAKRLKLANFLKQYITRNIKGYNIVKEANKWIGKKVEVVKYKNQWFISIP